MGDRISRVRIEGVRTLANVDVPLRPLTVIIGENGAGKSTFIEVLELLRRLPGPNFVREFTNLHGGMRALLRDGESRITLGLDVNSGSVDDDLRYSITIGSAGGFPSIERETLLLGPREGHQEALTCIDRAGAGVRVFDQAKGELVDVGEIRSDQPVLGAYGALPPQKAIGRMKAVMEGIAVHLPYLVYPSWASGRDRLSPLREPSTLVLAERLERYGENLASAYHVLKNDYGPEHWRQTLEYVRLGLGPSVRDVQVRVDPGGGRVAIALQFSELRQPVPAIAISDGTLAYLAYVALFRLNGGESLIAFDEPEAHLHPRLLARVVGFFEAISSSRSVILATQSDRVLDSLAVPEEAAVLIELDAERRAGFRWPNAPALREWLDQFAGFAELRSTGNEGSFFTESQVGEV